MFEQQTVNQGQSGISTKHEIRNLETDSYPSFIQSKTLSFLESELNSEFKPRVDLKLFYHKVSN